MIDGSKKRGRWLCLELQNLRVFKRCSKKKRTSVHFVLCGFFQEAQDKLLELDRLSSQLDAFVEKTKNATIEETEVIDLYTHSCSQFAFFVNKNQPKGVEIFILSQTWDKEKI